MELGFSWGVKSDSPQWQDWRWQVKNRITQVQQLPAGFRLSESEKGFFQQQRIQKGFPFQVTPYYLSLLDPENPCDPLRLMVFGQDREFLQARWGWLDPLGEQSYQVTRRVIHRYPDRALVLVTDQCSVYCRFCFRRHFTGGHQSTLTRSDLRELQSYLMSQPRLREVILTGGDALLLSDEKLKWILHEIAQVPHIERIRLATRMPVVCPMRITPSLLKVLKSYRPIFIMTHFNHPRELTDLSQQALKSLTFEGIVVLNQTVLLNGVNTHPAVLAELFLKLLNCQVKPYYLFHCDPAQGIEHFMAPLWAGAWILGQLWGHLSGLSLPQWAAELAQIGSKVWLHPSQFIDSWAPKGYFWQWRQDSGLGFDAWGRPGKILQGKFLRFPEGWWSYQKSWSGRELRPSSRVPEHL